MIDLNYIKQVLFNSSGKVFLMIAILIVTIFIERIIKYFLKRFIDKSSKKIKVDPTKYNFFKHSISAIIYILGISIAIYSIPELRAVSVSIFASAGILAVIIGFASQQAFSNIVSGIFIIIFKPFSVGNRIKISNEIGGIVEDITLRHTVIRNWENKRIIMPNSKISDTTIENPDITDPKICKWFEMSISYDSDVKKAKAILREEAMKHKYCIDNRTEEEKKSGEPVVVVRVISYGDFSVNLRAWIWTPDAGQAFILEKNLLESVKERFDKEGIEIPFPYRTIVYKKDIEEK